MLAVVPMDAGRSCGLLSSNGSMMDAARAWVPHASPAAFGGAERQTASPIIPNLPGPRGCLAARRRQAQAPHRRHGRNATRESTGWKATPVGLGGAGGDAVLVQAACPEGAARPRGVHADGAVAVNSNLRQRSQERGAPVEDAGGIRSLRRSRGRGGSGSSGSAGSGVKGAPGCGEAWGADAYGLRETDQHNSTRSRGNAADSTGTVRHGRWKSDHEGGTVEKDPEGARATHGRVGRPKAPSYEGASSGHVLRFRGGKVRQKRPSAAAHGRSTGTADRRSSRDGPSSRGGAVGDGALDGGREADQTSALTTVAVLEGPPQVGAASVKAAETAAPSGDTPSRTDLRSADQIQRALEDLLVPRRGSTASPHPSCCSGTTLGSGAGTDPTAATNKEHLAILAMDGRGGSAAPPHRPSLNLKVPASASQSSVLPGLATGIGFGVSATPPVSRQRSHSHHSPWQARKHPRGFSRGRGGAGFGRHHRHHHHPAQERPLLEERPPSGSSTTARLGSCFSSESTERAPVVFSSPSADSAPAVSVAPSPPQDAAGTVRVAAAATRGQQGANPFDRLLHPHHPGDEPSPTCGGAAGAIAASPRCDLIDHFKLATRPTSRRGSRKQGECTPEPAFCLFSRGGVGVNRARGAGEEERRRSSSAKDFHRH
ncbi:unnamed protein product [Scytosiphon promiscuus]